MCTLKGYFSTNFHILYVQVSDVYTFLVGNEIMANCKKAPFKVRPNWMSQSNTQVIPPRLIIANPPAALPVIDFSTAPCSSFGTASVVARGGRYVAQVLGLATGYARGHKGHGQGFRAAKNVRFSPEITEPPTSNSEASRRRRTRPFGSRHRERGTD